MASFRVIVTDSNRAVIYELATARSALQKVGSFENPAAHKRDKDLGSGPPGRVMGSSGSARHAYQPRHTLKEHATEEFVRSVAATLAKTKDGEAIILVGSPRLLSVFRKHVPRGARRRIAAEVPRDLMKVPKAELTEYVRTAIAKLKTTVLARTRA